MALGVIKGVCVKRQYLGDSYDIVKRLWQDLFAGWAPMYAEPRFIPPELQPDFTRLTGIRMLGPHVPESYSVLNDPDTGIRAPDGKVQSEGRSHIALRTIVDQCSRPGVQCVVTFDQSSHRIAGSGPPRQRTAKLQHLAQWKVEAFYYVSHAPFLFASSSSEALKHAVVLIDSAGIPISRLEHYR